VWAIDAWVRTRLDPAAIARIDGARHVALRELEREIMAESPLDADHLRAGIPSPAVARAMLASLSTEVVESRAA